MTEDGTKAQGEEQPEDALRSFLDVLYALLMNGYSPRELNTVFVRVLTLWDQGKPDD